jgi:hypothetical protein
MLKEIQTRQYQLPTDLIVRINESRGVIDTAEFENFNLEPDKRMNIAMLSGRIGAAIAASPLGLDGDPVIDVSRVDYKQAYPKVLMEGLYFPVGDPRRARKSTRPRMMVVIGGANCTLTEEDAPGVIDRHDGVVVTGEERDKLVRSPAGLADTVEGKTLKKHGKNPNREHRDERVSLHVVETMVKSMAKLEELDKELIYKRALLYSMNRDARLIWRTSYLGKNLDKKRREADEIIHDTIELAAINLGYDTQQVNAAHRADFSNRYRRGSSSDLAQAWRLTTGLFGRYINAKRGKVNQSMNGCLQEIGRKRDTLPKAA